MQSTGHSSMQDLSITSMHGPAITYGMSSPSRPGCSRGGERRRRLLVGGVTGEQLRARVDVHGGVVDRGCDFTEADGDQPYLAVVVDDVSRGEDSRASGPHRRIDDDVPVVAEVETPLAQRAQVGDETQCCDHPLTRDATDAVGALDRDV